MKGKLLGKRYRIETQIGEGGMAFVYLATDEKLGRPVAVKVLHPKLAQNLDICERFRLEARAISAIEHPNIIKIYDFSGQDSDELWIVTEILQGSNLAEFLRTFPALSLHPIVATIIVREIIKALHKAHSSGIIHRDIKPENIMVLDDGRIKLMDFGIAKDQSRRNITMTGTFMGSPSYMSPEQIRGKDTDQRSDIYSLGILYYEIVTGTLPYQGSSIPEVINKIMIGKYIEPMQIAPGLPRAINDFITKAISGDPGERYQTVKPFGQDLDAFLNEYGFAESHIELERYFISRKSFEERLAGLGFERRLKAYRPLPKKAPTAVPQPTRHLRASVLVPEAQETLRQKPRHPTPAPMIPGRQRPQYRTQSLPISAPISQPSRPLQDRRSYWRQPSIAPQASGPARPQVVHPRRRVSPPMLPPPSPHIVLHRQQRPTYIVVPSRASSGLSTLVLALLVIIGVVGIWQVLRHPEPVEPRPKVVEKRPLNKAPKSVPSVVPPLVETAKTEPSERPVVKKPPAPERRPQSAPIVDPNNAPSSPSGLPSPTPTQIAAPPPAQGRGRLLLQVQPAAELRIDGKLVGTTNDRILSQGIPLRAGWHRIDLRRKGYTTLTRPLQIRPGEEQALNLVLMPAVDPIPLSIRTQALPARLLIENTVDGSTVRDQSLTKKTTTINLDPGVYRVRVTYGKQAIQRIVTVDAALGGLNFNAEFK